MFKIQSISKFAIVPMNGILDYRLSLSAKGLYTILFSCNTDNKLTLEDIKEMTSISKDELNSAINELLEYKYILIDKKEDYKVLVSSTVKADKEILNEIRRYTKDKELEELLMKYFSLRANPSPKSRFYSSVLTVDDISKNLKQLENLKCDKKLAVKAAIENEYFKFVNIKPVNNAKVGGSASNDKYSKEELQSIREALEEAY